MSDVPPNNMGSGNIAILSGGLIRRTTGLYKRARNALGRMGYATEQLGRQRYYKSLKTRTRKALEASKKNRLQK